MAGEGPYEKRVGRGPGIAGSVEVEVAPLEYMDVSLTHVVVAGIRFPTHVMYSVQKDATRAALSSVFASTWSLL